MKEYAEEQERIKDTLLNLRLHLNSLQAVHPTEYYSVTRIANLMRNTEESALISAINGPGSKDLEKLVDAVLRKNTSTDSAFTDPAVGMVYQEVMRGYFTPDVIAKCLPTITNAQKFQDFERLTMCVVKMYEMMDAILESLRNKHKTKEAEIFKTLTKNILQRAADSLNEKFYYKTNLVKLIDDLFYDLENAVAMQESIRSNLEDQEIERSQALKRADFEKALSNRKSVDCGISRFSDLTGMGISRLITKINSVDNVVFDFINFEGNLREMMKRGIQRTDFCNEKFVFFFLNDRRRIKHFDFFKIILIEIESNMQVKKTEITHFEDHPSQLDKQQVMHGQYFLEENSSSPLKFDKYFENKMEILFEDDVAIYNIQSKLLLTMYQIIFKQFIVDKLRTDFFKQGSSDIPKVTITIENLYDFLNFVKSGRVGLSTFDPSQLRMMESGLNRSVQVQGANPRVNNFVSPGMLEDSGRYDVHQSLLPVYGGSASRIDGSQRFNTGAPQDRQANSQIPLSFLQSVLLANQKKLEVAEDDSRRRNMADFVANSSLLATQHVDTGDYDRERAEKMAAMQAERLDREQRALAAAEERERERQRLAEAAREKADRERKEREERMEKEKKDREERQRVADEERAKKDAERTEREKKIREEQEERDRRLRDEKAQREIEEKQKREAWEKDEKEKREARDKAAREQAERDRAERESREQAAREQADRDRHDREAREQAAREQADISRKEREAREQEAREQADKDRREREARDQAAREQADRERALRDQVARDQADRDRQDREARDAAAREQADKDRKDREAREQADREARELADKERADREERLRRDQADREMREREEEAERIRLQIEKNAQEERLRIERLNREQEEEEERERLKALKLKQEADAEAERKRLEEEQAEKEEEERQKELARIELENKKQKEIEERKKAEAESSKKIEVDDFDDDFGNIDEDFGDFEDEFGGSTEKKKNAVKPPSKPPSPKADSKAASKPATQKEIVTKKNAPADEEFDFGDDDFDDFLNEDLEESKKSKAKIAPPKKVEPIPEPVEEIAPAASTFAGGLKGLKKKADETKTSQPNAKAERLYLENPLGHERVLKSLHLPLIDAYIRESSPLDEDQIQQVMSTMQVDHQMVCLIFNEFIRNQTVFILDYEQTNEMLKIWAKAIEDNGRLDMAMIGQLGKMLGQLLQGTFENEPFDKIKYFFCPFIEIDEVQNEAVVQAMVDLKNKQVFLVSFNPEMNLEAVRSSPTIHMLANILAKSLSIAMTGEDSVDIPSDNIYVADLQPQLHQFLVESCEGAPEVDEEGEGEGMGYPYLRLMMISYLVLYEPASDRLDIEGFKKSLGVESFELEHAGRFVSTMNATRESLTLRMQLQQTPELADGLMQTVEAIISEKKCQVIPKLAEKVTPPEEVEDALIEDLKQLNDLRKSSDKVFSVLEYLLNEEGDKKLLYFIALQHDDPDVVMYLGVNDESQNKKCLSLIETTLQRASGKPPQILYEHHRHQFATDNVDIFAYCWPILVYEVSLQPDDALRCLVYNEQVFVNELMQGLMGGEEEQNPNDLPIGMEDSNERGVVEDPNADGDEGDDANDFGDDDFDFDDEIDDKPKPSRTADVKRPTSALPNLSKPAPTATKPKESNIDYDFDDDEFGPPTGAGGNNNQAGNDFDDIDDFDF